MDFPPTPTGPRLPSERLSFPLQVTRGSAWTPLAGQDGGFRWGGARSGPECLIEIALTRVLHGDRFEQVFLTDADVLTMSDAELDAILLMLRDTFPGLKLVSAAARPASALSRSPEALRRLRDGRLGLLYFAPESGDPDVMRRIGVDGGPDDFAAAAQRVSAGGLLVGAVIVLGAGGPTGSAAHADASAALLSRMRPRHVTVVAQTDCGLLGPRAQLLDELARLLVATRTDDTKITTDLDVDGRPFEGRLPNDRDALLARVRGAILPAP